MIRRLLGYAVFIVLAEPLVAQDPQIRCTLEPTDSKTIYVGQQVTLVCELLVPGYFASAATFDLPDPPGFVLMPPAEHPIVSSEDQGGTSFTVQRHELWAFPQRPGKQTIPAFKVRFAYKKAPLDKQDLPVELQSQPIELEITQPPGTESLGMIISAHDLKADEFWEPEIGQTAKLGDAYTRTIVFTADGLPGSLFPAFPITQMDGLGIYSKQAVADHVDRGQLHGQRQTIITYVCKQAGTFQIPAAQLSWWDLDANELKKVDFPARTLQIAASTPEQSDTPEKTSQSISLKQFIALVIGSLAIALVAGLFYKYAHAVASLMCRALKPFQAVHLQPLNPPDGPRSTTKY